MTQKQSSTGNLVVSGKHFFARSRSHNKSVGGLLFLLCMMALGETAFAATRYVKPGATGDGSSWANAGALQATVTAAASGDEVWVAAGTYTASASPVLTMKAGVLIYGGFVGTETLRTERDWSVNVTTIDGQDARRCVIGANNATIDGFVIAHGKAQGVSPDYDGGGLYNNSALVTVANCTFTQNSSTHSGGGICNMSTASMVVENCAFIQNTAAYGGGIYTYSSAATAFGCIFTNNSASTLGGGFVAYNCSPTLVNCVFTENSAPSGGGIRNSVASPTITNCTFSANTATNGGGIHNDDAGSAPKITNCILWGNTATTGPQINAGTPVVTYSCVQGGYTGTGNINTDPMFTFPMQPYDLRLQSGSPCIDTATMTGAPISDLLGVSRPQGLGVDMGAYEGSYQIVDTDGDGLPDAEEAGQGCDPGVADADLGVAIDAPSEGAVVRALPMTVLGRLFSPDVTTVLIHGVGTSPVAATLNGLNWTCSLTPAAAGSYTLQIFAYNRFGGRTSSSVSFSYQPNYPAAWIASPLTDAHVKGTVAITGTAIPGQYGLGRYDVLYRAGEDTTGDTGWTLINTSTVPVTNETLASWDVSALPTGTYALRLYVVDELGIYSATTYRLAYVDLDNSAPAAPAPLTISGLVPPYGVATGLQADVTGTAEPGSTIGEAVTIDADTGVVLSDVTNNLGVRLNGVIYGQVQFPLSALLAKHIALRIKVKDAVGNISEATTSNSLLPDSTGLNVVMWDGGGDGTTWSQATNWVGDVVPSTSADVLINTGLSTTITISSSITVNSLQCGDNLSITSGGLTVKGASTVLGAFTIASGASLTATTIAAAFTAAGIATINGANIYAFSGGQIIIVGATQYFCTTSATIKALGIGSTIRFNNVSEIRAANGYSLDITAQNGGLIDFPSVQQIKYQANLISTGNGSRICMSSLTTVDGLPGGDYARVPLKISVSNEGMIEAPVLTNIIDTGISVYNGLTLDLHSAKTLTATIEVGSNSPTLLASGNGSVLDLSGVTLIKGGTTSNYGGSSLNITASSGGQINLSSANDIFYTTFVKATGLNSQVRLDNLVKVDGKPGADYARSSASLAIEDNGTIFIPRLTTLIDAALIVSGGLTFDASSVSYIGATCSQGASLQSTGIGSVLNLSGLLEIWGPTTSNYGGSSITVNASGGALIDMSSILQINRQVNVTATGLGTIIDLSSITSIDATGAQLSAPLSLTVRDKGCLLAPVLAASVGTSFYSYDGSEFSLPSLKSISSSSYVSTIQASGLSAKVELPDLTSVTGTSNNVVAVNGGTVIFSSLSTISGTVNASSQGNTSLIDLPSLAVWSSSSSAISAQNGGLVNLGLSTAQLNAVSITLQTQGVLPGVVKGGTVILDKNSALSGKGEIQANFVCDAPVSPGGTGNYGTITFCGDYTQTSNGKLNLDFSGTTPSVQYDQIFVTGQATLGGTLVVTLLSSFVPAINDRFDVVMFGSRSGQFAALTGMDLGGGRTMKAIYRPTRLILGERAGLITPAVPVLSTPRNVPMQYDLSSHTGYAAQPSWSIDPADTSLYTATIDENEVLTITPKPNEYGAATPTLTLSDLADGFSDVQDLDLTVELILPTPPIPFVFPTGDPLETDNLICGLLPGTVGPGCPILYRYIWTNAAAPGRPPEYPPFEAKTVVHGPDVFVVDILDASETSPYETWTCTVYSFDGQYESDVPGIATSGVIQPLTPTTLSFTLSPDTITLGQPITLSGSIDPTVGVVPLVFDAATPPGGTNTKPANINTNSDSTFSVAFQPNEVGGWGFTASWPGNSTHWGSSATAALTVNKAQPNLLLSLSHTSALLNLANAEDFEIAATLTVAGFPAELQSLLAGRPVRLSVQTPDGQTPWAPLETVTDAGGVAHFDKMAFDAAGVTFNTSGVWRFRAEFAGDENLHSTVTEDFGSTLARLTIKEGAGYAILVLGRLDGFAEGHAEHGQTTDYIYSVLQGRGFVDEDIQYLREFLPGEINRGYPVDGAATAANLQVAIETWARDKMLASPAPLYLILVDHGNPGIFYMDIGSTGPVESITAGDLNGWLSVLQSALGQKATGTDASERSEAVSALTMSQIASSQAPRNDEMVGTDSSERIETGLSLLANPETGDSPVSLPGVAPLVQSPKSQKSSAAEMDITLIYGACYSGSFIPALSGPKRILITSSAADEIAYRGVINEETGLRDGDFFLTEFFRNAGEGRTLKDAFELACVKTYEYTATRTGSSAVIPQHPQLDDNADAMGTTGYLSTTPGLDGALVAGMDLGLGANAGNGIGWFTALPPVTLSPGGTLPDGLWAEATGRELLPGDTAWLELKTPTYDDGTVATPGYEAFQRIAALVGPITCTATPEDLGGGRTRFTWSQANLEAQLTDGFTTPGTYKAYYFLRDGETGQVGAYLVTNVYVSQTGNQPPPAVQLLYPDDDGTVNATLFLAWTESVDPNADVVTYRVEVSEDPLFPTESTIVRDGLSDTVTTLSSADGILNDHDYYWRVIPTDPYGATPEENDVRRFLVRGSPGVPGAITGKVTVSGTSMCVTGAILTLTPTSQTGVSTGTGAYFLGDVSQGVYNLSVSAPGYVTAQHTGVIVTSGRYTTLNVPLEPEMVNHAPVWTPIGDKWVIAGRTLSFQVAASDIDLGQTLTYTISSLPAGAVFDSATRTFTWTPVMGQVRTAPYEVAFTVTDDGDPALSVETFIGITVDRGAYISGPSHAVIGDRVELEYHGEYQPGLWHVQWDHDGTVIPDENDELLALESVTFDDAGWYTATQVSDTKVEPVSASFYLNVVEAVPLHGWAVLVALTCVALVAAGRVGTVGRVGRRVK